MPLPGWAQNAPELYPGLEFFFGAFFDLDGDRMGQGFGLGRIPYLTILQYGKEHGLEGDDLEDLIYHVRQMDEEYLAYYEEKSKQSRAETSFRDRQRRPR